jgi:hypothetical protein
MSELRSLVAEVERARRDYLARVQDVSPELGTRQPAAGTWSLSEITEHLVVAERNGVNSIWAAADRARAGKPWDGAVPHSGMTIEAIVAKTWREKEDVPKGAEPAMGGPLAYWATTFSSLTTLLSGLEGALEGLDIATVVHPHPISGPLDARQRLQFLRFHIDRHREQVERVRAAIGA